MIGAFILELVSEFVWSKFIEIHGMILGMLIILIVIFIPKGLFETFKGGFSFRKIIINLRENKL